jgi:hypothetical protein
MKKMTCLLFLIFVLLFTNLNALTIPITVNEVVSDQIVNLNSRAGDQNGTTIDLNSKGEQVISWRSGVQVIVQKFDQDGSPQGNRFIVNDVSCQSAPRIALAEDGSTITVWSGDIAGIEDILLQGYNSANQRRGDNIIVNIHQENSNSDYPDIAMMNNGNFVIVWQKDDDIYAKLFSDSGVVVTESILVNDDTEYELQRRPVVGISENGSFTVAWYDRRDRTADIMNYDIFAQRFDSTGNKLGANFKVNDEESSAYNQIDPSIAMDSIGNFIITWRDYRNDPSDIFAQRYDQNGNLIGTNFKVTDDGGSSGQAFPAVSMDNNGIFGIAWLDTRDGFVNIYAQLYENDNLLGENFPIPDQSAINDINKWNHPFIQVQDSKLYSTWVEERNSLYEQDILYNILEFSKLYVDTKSISDISTNSVFATGTLYREDFSAQHGFCWNTTGDPSIEDDSIFLGNKDTIGSFSSTISGLLPNTVYYLRAFTCNDAEEYKYGEIVDFRTYALPIVNDLFIIEEEASLQLQASISDLGYPNPTQHGFCWSTNAEPTHNNDRVRFYSVNDTGSYTWTVQNLQDNTHYYFRAYVTNAAGTVYSSSVDFTYIETSISKLPSNYELGSNFPNPFNPVTTISYQLPAVSDVQMIIFDISGRKIRQWSYQGQAAGTYKIKWNGKDSSGNLVPSGVYIYRLIADDFVNSKKMVLLK